MFRSTRWYARELARREQTWAVERAQLISTICRLAGNPAAAPLPLDFEPAPVDDTDSEFDFVHPDFL